MGQRVVRIDGRLDSHTIPILLAAIGNPPVGPGITLEISGLASMDLAGKACLIDLRRSGVQISGPSLYIHALLQEAHE